MKLIVRDLSAFKNYEGQIGFVIPNSQKGFNYSLIWFSPDDSAVVPNDKLDDVFEHHLLEELEENEDLCIFAQSYDLVEECHRDVIGFINYSLEYN